MSENLPSAATPPATGKHKYDVAIIGAGFAGLSAAMQLARARRNICVIDAGEPRNRFATTAHGFLGHDGKTPDEIRSTAIDQLCRYDTVDFRNGLVTQAMACTLRDASDPLFGLKLADGSALEARRIILATGVRDQLPEIPGLAERWGETVLHCPYCHGYEIRDSQIGVLATTPASSHQAMMLPDWGPTTYFSQSEHIPDDDMLLAMRARGITIEDSPVVEVLGTAPAIDGVRLADGRTLPIQTIFAGPSVSMPTPVADMLECQFDEGPQGSFITVSPTQETSVPGVFAAGDAATARHNATLASAAGVMAGFGAHQSLVFR
ncbi:NAD(P)/FAD-dependent oxidoreductase [Thalassospira australica]|uniref:NAD(P)/FAD-dependent oxidoreductase n=1 Tax=Thalassospira australica TaxID=1528106 RepID=UPI0006916D01|nr:NAD(P)/FAD-dependent oxidoreductase [Thalassospira australica]